MSVKNETTSKLAVVLMLLFPTSGRHNEACVHVYEIGPSANTPYPSLRTRVHAHSQFVSLGHTTTGRQGNDPAQVKGGETLPPLLLPPWVDHGGVRHNCNKVMHYPYSTILESHVVIITCCN